MSYNTLGLPQYLKKKKNHEETDTVSGLNSFERHEVPNKLSNQPSC